MASYQLLGPIITVQAGADLSAAMYRFVDIDANGRAILASAGGRVAGVTTDKAALNRECPIQTYGVAEVDIGTGGLAAGDSVKSEANGKAVKAASTNLACGIVLEGGAAGGRAAILFVRHTAP